MNNPLEKITKRSDYIEMRKGHNVATDGFILQAKQRTEDWVSRSKSVRFGITCSKRLGNAVKRNRCKRRLRALAKEILPKKGIEGWDYVLIGRFKATETLVFTKLRDDFVGALLEIQDEKDI